MSRRLMLRNESGATPILPSEYQQVEWVKCDSASWFYINRKPTSGMQISVDGAIGVTNLNNAAVFASGDPNLSGNIWYIATQIWATAWIIRSYADNSTGLKTLGTRDTNRHLFTIDSANESASVDESSVNLPFSTHVPSYNIYIGRNAVAYSSSQITIYRVWLNENGALIMNFIPCYRKADGVIGLYDTVSDNFLANGGTGTLTKGADV